jgi:tetratricopeptide (TPR) repeat protein
VKKSKWPAFLGVFILLAGILWFTPLGKALRDWWINQQDQRLYGKACQAWEAQRFEEARGDCDRIVQNEPAFAGALVILGKYYAEIAAPPDWAKAADYESRALQAKPDLPTLLAYGGSLWKLGKFPDSEKALRDYLQQNPGNPEAYKQLGWVLVCEKEYEKALGVYAQGLKLDPDNKEMKGWRREALRRLARQS